MTEEEKFTFDLEGYLVIKDVLSARELDDLNALVDEHLEGWDNDSANDLNKVSCWGAAATNLIDHGKIVPYLVELLGPRFRIDHDYAIIMNQGDSRGGLHGGPRHNGDHWFSYRDGEMRNGLSVVTFFLADANAGDGGFACVPGSHKAFSNLPPGIRTCDDTMGLVKHVDMRAGDVLFFGDGGTTHGA